MTEKHRQAVELLSELRKTKEQIDAKSGKVTPDVLYSLLQVNKARLLLLGSETFIEKIMAPRNKSLT